ncbi:hypothetical protein VMCG_05720 [Cytospora schulzeri]|uniref:Uncharacterized protein n=1 Tax=Cytospora schulzeri TaxID=448051 RepID=A0A423WI24_9PEZI|nr:hypothetical protein VMCG_05720 [Valsa malicola]
MSLLEDEPSKLSTKYWLHKLAGPDTEKPAETPRPYLCHSATMMAICFFVGLVMPAILITSVAYFQHPLVVAHGCQRTDDASGYSSTFTCDSVSLTKVAIILACVHMAVGAICMPAAWVLAKRMARRRLNNVEESKVKKEAGNRAVKIEMERRRQNKEEEDKRQLERKLQEQQQQLYEKYQKKKEMISLPKETIFETESMKGQTHDPWHQFLFQRLTQMMVGPRPQDPHLNDNHITHLNDNHITRLNDNHITHLEVIKGNNLGNILRIL